MMEYAVKTPTIPIPFHKLLRVVALVDAGNHETRALLDRLATERFEVEISDRYDRDVLEDAAVGAYIAAIDGDRLEPARNLVASGARRRLQYPAVGACGLAPHLASARTGSNRRGRRLHLPRPADAGIPREAGDREHHGVWHDACCRRSSAG